MDLLAKGNGTYFFTQETVQKFPNLKNNDYTNLHKTKLVMPKV